MAKKQNENADQIDLTVFDFVGGGTAGFNSLAGKKANAPTCGSCHPGSGGLEFDRAGNRYDTHQKAHPGLSDSFDGDYYKAAWDKSGVVEADCLLCHLARYDFNLRTRQLKKKNYRWAATAASGLGLVKGAVAAGEEPRVLYNRRFFNEDGTVVIDVSWPPPDDNCMHCHGKSDMKKRGFSWNDIHNPDVHNQQGLFCVACHPAGPDHNIAKGDENVSTVRDDLDNTILSCEECHSSGYLGASIPTHPTVRISHLKKISCEACHIPQIGRAAVQYLDTTNGKFVSFLKPLDAKAMGAHASWKPVYERRKDGKIYPVNPIRADWIGNKDADGIIQPLFFSETKKAFTAAGDRLKDDNGNGAPEANTESEIRALLKATADSLKGNRRFASIHPVLVKGGFVYEINEAGALTKERNEIAHAHGFSLNHNVAPAKQALGAGGCKDCHSCESHFFVGKKVTDMVGEDGKPVLASMGPDIGCSPLAFKLGCYYQKFLTPYIGLLIVLVAFVVVVHYHSFGPKVLDRLGDEPATIRRFRLSERIGHLARLISFLVLASTGLIWAYSSNIWMRLLFGTQANLYWSHVAFGFIFIIATAVGFIQWWKDAFFTKEDVAWVKKAGGYLKPKSHEEIPSGRFNAGQKMFFWFASIAGLILFLTGFPLIFKEHFPCAVNSTLSIVHNFVALVMIAGVLAHIYLGVIANPGTWRVLVDGLVSKTWAKHHHPDWYRQVITEEEEEEGNESE